jgi:hypothetical protein
MGFPKLLKDLKGESWSDYRIDKLEADRADWTARLEAGVERKVNSVTTTVGDKVITTRDIVIKQEIYIIKWNRSGVLELRTPIGASNDHRNESLSRIQSSLHKLFPHKDNFVLSDYFDPIDLRPSLLKIRAEIDKTEGKELFSWFNIQLEHTTLGIANVKSWSSEESILDDEHGQSLFDRYGACSQAAITWNFDRINVLPGEKQPLPTLIGYYGMNTVHVRTHASAKAVKYVLDKLRQLA